MNAGTGTTRPQPQDSRGRRASRAGDSDAGAGRVVQRPSRRPSGCYPDYINRWKQRFETERLAGPAREVSWATADGADARDGSADSGEDAAAPAGRQHALEHAQVGQGARRSVMCWSRRVWRRAGLQPHRLERYMLSDDPDFEQKAADVIGLYLNPPQHAVVFAADEKTAIQALDRLDPGAAALARAAPNATALSTTGTARSRCTPRSTRRPARSSARPCPATPATRSSSS